MKWHEGEHPLRDRVRLACGGDLGMSVNRGVEMRLSVLRRLFTSKRGFYLRLNDTTKGFWELYKGEEFLLCLWKDDFIRSEQ